MSRQLSVYEQADRLLLIFEAEHAEIMQEYCRLQESKRLAEEELKIFARENGPEEGEYVSVLVTHKSRRWYDSETVLRLRPDVRSLVVVESVDGKKLDALIKAEMISADVAEQALRQEPMTSAVSIRRKG